MILKESKSWGEKKEERTLNTLRQRYIYAGYINMLVNKYMTMHLTSVAPTTTITTS